MTTDLIVDFRHHTVDILLTGIIVAYNPNRGTCTVRLGQQVFIDVMFHPEKPEIFDVDFGYHCWPASLEEIC